MCRYHSRHVRARILEVGDLVLRRILSREGLHKLSTMWEGPFKVTHISRPGSARLETAEGVPVGDKGIANKAHYLSTPWGLLGSPKHRCSPNTRCYRIRTL
jgi:hypothetical protein